MQHFSHLDGTDKGRLFHREPVAFTKESRKELLAASLGATIYCPSTRPDLFNDLKKMRAKDATSVVVCLEDSIADSKVEEGEKNLTRLLKELEAQDQSVLDELPLLFVRPRNPAHLWSLFQQNDHLLRHLTGFTFPKFDLLNGAAQTFTSVLAQINRKLGSKLYYMPVLESPAVIHRETRDEALSFVSTVLHENKDSLLAVRIGATDMSSAFGLRRSPDFTIYDVQVVSSAIADIVNAFGRTEFGTVITGAVWEHFDSTPRMLKPQLRETIFNDKKPMRSRLLHEDYDMLLREIQLDKINGITGKTVIHPTHIGVVHSLSVVTHEEYCDAMDVLSSGNSAGGAYASAYRNKMNEVKPHTAWAKKVLNRAEAFGVSKEGIDFSDFLEGFEL